MKSQRRHELQYNILDQKLTDLLAWLKKYSTYIAWGVTLVVVAVAITFMGAQFQREEAPGAAGRLRPGPADQRRRRPARGPSQDRRRGGRPVHHRAGDGKGCGRVCPPHQCQRGQVLERGSSEAQRPGEGVLPASGVKLRVPRFRAAGHPGGAAHIGLARLAEDRGQLADDRADLAEQRGDHDLAAKERDTAAKEYDAAAKEYSAAAGVAPHGSSLAGIAQRYLQQLDSIRRPVRMATTMPAAAQPATGPATGPATTKPATGHPTTAPASKPAAPTATTRPAAK